MAEYIEKDKAVGIAHGYCHTKDGRCCGPDDVVELYEELKSIPAADVEEVRHGRWEDTNKSVRCHNAYRFNWWCSECGKPQHTPVAKTLGEFTKENPFCHCCGAKMDGGADDGKTD